MTELQKAFVWLGVVASLAGIFGAFQIGREWGHQDKIFQEQQQTCSTFCIERGFSVSRVAEGEWKGVASCFCREPSGRAPGAGAKP